MRPSILTRTSSQRYNKEACIEVLGIHDICILLPGIKDTFHFTSRDMGFCVHYIGYFQGY